MDTDAADEKKSLVSKILISRLLTRSGDQAWEFAVPITMVYVLPNSLPLVAFIFFCSKLGSLVLQPWVASVIDRWMRLKAALLGTCTQVAGVLLVTATVFSLSKEVDAGLAEGTSAFYSQIAGVIIGSILSSLGSSLIDIAVGNDWIPAAVPESQLSSVNSRMRQIDLATEVGSPVVAGGLIATLGNGPMLGFLLIALWNLSSFVPEILLLRNVFLNSPRLQRAITAMTESRRTGVLSQISRGWHEFRIQSCYLVMVAYAVLWLSALSPHGVLLTGYLKSSWGFSDVGLGVFRGLGAVCGLASTFLFPIVRAKMGLVRGSLFFIALQAILLVASVLFFVTKSANGWIFLGLILLSRIGLYGFSLGEMELRQRTIAEGSRGAVNGVASSLTSLATLVLFGLGTVVPQRESFLLLVLFSVTSVCVSATIVFRWSRRERGGSLV